MRKIVIELSFDHDFMSDVDRIVNVLKDRGIDCSRHDAAWMWDQYSDSMAAGWMMLPDDDEHVYGCISYYVNLYAVEV